MDDQWARSRSEHFGDLRLPDPRLTLRLGAMVTRVLERPAGTVTAVFPDVAEREAAYRWLESSRVRSSDVLAGLSSATVRRASAERRVLIPIDGSSLTVVDRKKRREVGVVGPYRAGARGLIVATAFAVTTDGTPVGVCGQQWWARDPAKRSNGRKSDKRKSEMLRAVELVDQVTVAFAEKAPKTEVWFQLDRGYDAQLLLEHLSEREALFTVRASANRRLDTPKGKPRKYVEEAIRARKIIGTHHVEVPARHGHPARSARLDVRVLKTTVSLKRSSKTRYAAEFTYVDVRERKRHGLRWTLITSAKVESLADALVVVDAYATRWRIEEFHRAWKDGVCHVEDSQLRSREALIKWATILAAVAARATRLAYLARTKPELPVATEFDVDEVTAAVLLHKRPVDVDTLNLGDFIQLVARLGGYTGKSSGGPPGATTISRGLSRVLDAATLLRALRERPELKRKLR